jgi:cob(I)alamin adenosyltransferase
MNGQPSAPPGGALSLYDLSDEGRARQRAAAAAARRARQGRRGLLIVHTGDGKGKTTAAFGLVMRAWGRGLRVVVFQFIKHATGNWGERRAAGKMGIEVVGLGAGFTWESDRIEHDRALAEAGWARCRAAIESGDYDVVVLDEITYCLNFGWLDLAEVLGVLGARRPGSHVVLTGRDAPAELIDAADLVTEMREVKHPFRAGIKAQPGVEF